MADRTRFNPIRGTFRPLLGGGGFNQLAAGRKRYGHGGIAPNVGPVADKSGYAMRDRKYDSYLEALRRVGGK